MPSNSRYKEGTMHLKSVAEVRTVSSQVKLPDPNEFHEADHVQELRQALKGLYNDIDTNQAIAYDDLTGMRLEGSKVIEARAKEL